LSKDQINAEAGPERLRDLAAARSQIDYHLFIMKLLKEEHKLMLNIAIDGSEKTNVKDVIQMKMLNV
jgi:hypothetical protein